jgi:hypothetical protein
MSKIYKPRTPVRNAGFWWAIIGAFLSYGTVVMFVIGMLNLGWTASLITLGITFVIFLGTCFYLYRQLKFAPRQVNLEDDRIVIYDASQQPLKIEAEVPYDAIVKVTIADVPVEGGPMPRSYKGVLLRWRTPETESEGETETASSDNHEYVLSSSNVCDFDELFDNIFDRAPKTARGAKIFRA